MDHNHTQHHASSNNYNYTPGETHDFAGHADAMLGADVLAPGQAQYGGYAYLGANTIIARSPITGLRPVIEQAISQIVGTRTIEQAAQQRGGFEKLESAIAQQLTNLNDWQQLTTDTQNEIMIMTGINFDAMTTAEREDSINHLQHSPLPFGDIEEVLSTNMKIDMGITHTLDKNKTEVKDLGDGVWQVTMISNNNNGSHTGHNLGSFKIDLGNNADAAIAKQVGNSMVVNTNNNAKLYLDQAAKDVLYGNTESISFDHPEHDATNAPGAGHSFVEHVSHLYGEALIEGQESTGGYAFLSDNYIVGRSPITGLQPVVEQAISQILKTQTIEQAAKKYGGLEQLENKIAQQITNLNDWTQLTEDTQASLMIQTGINFDAMTKEAREATINHLLHSPLPFGEIQEVLDTGVKIDLGKTHTLDKNKTEVKDLGDGIWQVTMISNNNNGSHTGHNLGSFKIDLGANADAAIAKQVGNSMVVNTNDNTKLYLDQSARDVLYGNIEKEDFDMNNAFQSSDDDDHDHGGGDGDGDGDGHGGGDGDGDGDGATVIHDIANEMQFVIGETDNDVFNVHGRSDEYQWDTTDDGGYVIWKGDQADILYDVEKIQFTDKTVDLTSDSGGNNGGDTDDGFQLIQDNAEQTDYVMGSDIMEAFVINGNSGDYGWDKTDDGGVVVWSGDNYDILYDIEEIRFNDKTVNLLDSGDGGDNQELTLINDTKGETDYIIGTSANEAFVIDGNATDYGWDKTDDGGVVVWSGDNYDVLYDIEQINFNDEKIDLAEYAS